MTSFSIGQMQYTSVLYLHSEKNTLQLDPDYQRQSEIWTLEKRQLLIDSILNGFDIPKIYFHKFPKPKHINGKKYTHAIIDGKQRLTSIWSFIDGVFALSDDIEYIEDTKVDLRNLTYAELAQKHPRLKTKFDSYPLSVIAIDTDDIELIEEMFSRLNEAVPLSAAEKRNAFGGPMPVIIRQLTKLPFCKTNLPFGNRRYRQYDLIAKLLLIEDRDNIVDTKKIHLDEFVKSWKGKSQVLAGNVGKKVSKVLDKMHKVFTKPDPLLGSVGTLVVYYHLFRLAMHDGWLNEVTRAKLHKFEASRLQNRLVAEQNIGSAEYDLLEYDRFIQTPNDSSAIKTRLAVLLSHAFDRELLE